eukprot:237196_1
MLQILASYEDQLAKNRDEMLFKVELQYMNYIQALLSQKVLITESIRRTYDYLIKDVRNKMCAKRQTNNIIPQTPTNQEIDTSPTYSDCSVPLQHSVSNIAPETDCKQTTNTNSYTPHMSLKDAKLLSINDKIDHRDLVGCFRVATIIDKKGSNLKIHYDDWDKKWDVWCDCETELFKFAKHTSITERPRHRFLHLQKGNTINVNPMNKGWKTCKIISFYLGQIEVIYSMGYYNHYLWTHIDNEKEVTLLNTITNQNNNHASIALPSYQFNCLYCSKCYQDHNVLANHVQINHSDRRFVCSFCPFACNSENGLRSHELQHTRDESLKCNLCIKSFGCNTSFGHKASLTTHVNIIHKTENNKRSHGCKRKLKLYLGSKHKQKEKKYICQYCGEQFDRKHTKLSHERHVHEDNW